PPDRRPARPGDRGLYAARRRRPARRQEPRPQDAGLRARRALPSGPRRLGRTAHAIGAVASCNATQRVRRSYRAGALDLWDACKQSGCVVIADSTTGGAPVTARKKRKMGAPQLRVRQFLRRLGPGLITGASDDDPSGIGTYSQAGAQLGYGIGWTMLLTFPL